MTFISYRTYFILLNQIVGIIFCIYFILNIKSYEISAPLLNYFLPSVTTKINSLITKIGTLFLIIPLAIIIMALIHPENYKWKLYSSFFGITSMLIMLSRNWSRNAFGDYYDFKLILVTKIYTLEEKRIILHQALLDIIENNYKTLFEQYHYLKQKLIVSASDIYDTKLHLLQNKQAILHYAQELVNTEASTFLINKSVSLNIQTNNLATATKILFYVVVTVTVVCIGFAVYRFFTDGGALKEGAILSKTTAELASQNTENLQTTQKIADDMLSAIPEQAVTASIAVGTEISNATNLGFDKVELDIAALYQAQSRLASELSQFKKLFYDYCTSP